MSAAWVAAFLVLWVAVLLSLALQLGQMKRITAVLELVESRLRGSGWSPVSMGIQPGSKVPDFEAIDSEGGSFT